MSAVAIEPSQARSVLDGFRANPVRFVRDVLGGDPWPTSEAIMRAVAQPHARVAVKACHASSKTWSAAQVVLWWVATGGKCVTTAPTWTQVKVLLWSEIRKAYYGSRFPIGGKLNDTDLKLTDDVFALGLSTNEGVRFQGHHGARLLMVLDEAPGVKQPIWEAIEGARAGGDVRVLAQGNPMATGGPFYDAFAKDRSGWKTFTIDAFDTPNLAGVTLAAIRTMSDADLDKNERPYLVTRRWVREKLDEWGEQSPLWEAKVRGAFPSQSDDSLIGVVWIEAAKRSELQPEPSDRIRAGLDVAGPGEDETVLYLRRGPRIVGFHSWHQADPRGEVVAALGVVRESLETVNVDSAGIGHYMARHLADQGFPVVDVNAGSSPNDKERFANLKAEMCWGLRDRFKGETIAGLADEVTMSQLSTIRWFTKPSGQIAIESKDDARKRGLKSPDRAEALMLAFAPVSDKVYFGAFIG